MRLKKTNATNRITYTYCFDDGTQQVLRPGENGVTEMDIKKLHALDDSEVYYNIKNSRPPVSDAEKQERAEWIEKFRADFIESHGYAPSEDYVRAAVAERYQKNWTFSLNQYESDDDGGDTSDRHAELTDPYAFADPDDLLPPDVRRMREIVSSCTDKQREAYRLVYIEGYTEKEAAEIMDCTQQGVHKHIDLVKKKIKENF